MIECKSHTEFWWDHFILTRTLTCYLIYAVIVLLIQPKCWSITLNSQILVYVFWRIYLSSLFCVFSLQSHHQTLMSLLSSNFSILSSLFSTLKIQLLTKIMNITSSIYCCWSILKQKELLFLYPLLICLEKCIKNNALLIC